MILGMTIFFATLIILFNLLSDMLAIWLNPKLRQQQLEGITDGYKRLQPEEQGTSLWQDAWIKLCKNYLALFGLAVSSAL